MISIPSGRRSRPTVSNIFPRLFRPDVTGHFKTSHPWSLRSGHLKFISADKQFQFESLHQSAGLGGS